MHPQCIKRRFSSEVRLFGRELRGGEPAGPHMHPQSGLSRLHYYERSLSGREEKGLWPSRRKDALPSRFRVLNCQTEQPRQPARFSGRVGIPRVRRVVVAPRAPQRHGGRAVSRTHTRTGLIEIAYWLYWHLWRAHTRKERQANSTSSLSQCPLLFRSPNVLQQRRLHRYWTATVPAPPQ